ncbi:MAG: hypothetical protein ACMUIP_10055 [bacterium]
MFKTKNILLFMFVILLSLVFLFPMNSNAQWWGYYPYSYPNYYNTYSYGFYNPSTFTSSFYSGVLKYFRDPYAPYLNTFLGYYTDPFPSFINPYYSFTPYYNFFNTPYPYY